MTNETLQNPFPQLKPTFRFPSDQNLDIRVDSDSTGVQTVVKAARPIVLHQTTVPGNQNPDWYYFNVESDRDLTVYGDVVKIIGEISAPGRKIAIFARVLQIVLQTSGSVPPSLPSLDVSGDKRADAGPRPENKTKAQDGAEGSGDRFQFEIVHNEKNDKPGGDGTDATKAGMVGEQGENGKTGGPGGSIRIVCLEYEPTAALSMFANGGKGGNGGTGGNGPAGGDGGKGDDADRGAGFDRTNWSTPGGNGGRGAPGGRGGTGGAGGDGGTIIFFASQLRSGGENIAQSRYSESSRPDLPYAEYHYIGGSAFGGENGDPGDGGLGGDGGKPGAGGVGWDEDAKRRIKWTEEWRAKYTQWMDPEYKRPNSYDLLPSPPGQPGAPGEKGKRGFAQTAVPKNGSVILDIGSDTETLAHAVHSDSSRFALDDYDLLRQLRMSYNRARALYLTIGTPLLRDRDDERRKGIIAEIYKILDWISKNLEAMTTISDPELESFHATLRVNANSLLRYYLHQVDAFGHRSLYVPRGSFNYYYGQLDRAMELLYRMEMDYAEIVQSSKQADDFLAQVKQKEVDVSQHLNALQVEVTMTWAELGEVAAHISRLEDDVFDARRTFSDKVKDLAENLKAESGLDLGELLEAMEMMAFTGFGSMTHTLPMAGVQLGKLVYSNAERAMAGQVTDDYGRKIKKDYLLAQVKELTGDFSKVGEGFHALKAGGAISMQDRGAARLYVEKEKFDAFFNGFLTNHSAQNAKQALDEYVDRIQERNLEIDTYNLLVTRYFDDRNQIRALKTQQNLLAGAENSNLRSQKTKDYLLSAYNSVRDRCIFVLYMTGRAYFFLSLQRLDLLGEQLALGKPDDINLHSIIVAKSRIIDADVRAIENRVTPISKAPPTSPTLRGRGATIAYVRAAPENEKKYDLVVKGTALLNRLEKNLHSSIHLTWDSMSKHGNSNPFADKANVRLRRVRCWIYGMQTTNHIHRIRLVHGGIEEIVRKMGEVMEFKHKPLQIEFEYNSGDPEKMETVAAINAGGSETPLLQEDGSFIGQGVDLWDASNYAPVGPFTKWEIFIGHNAFPTVGANGEESERLPIHIEKLVLEFFYYYDPAKLEKY